MIWAEMIRALVPGVPYKFRNEDETTWDAGAFISADRLVAKFANGELVNTGITEFSFVATAIQLPYWRPVYLPPV